jgi:hypothetical protein
MSEGFQSQVLGAPAELRGGITKLCGGFADLQEAFAEQRAVLDRVEGKVDRVAAEMAIMRPRVTALESEQGHSVLITLCRGRAAGRS